MKRILITGGSGFIGIDAYDISSRDRFEKGSKYLEDNPDVQSD